MKAADGDPGAASRLYEWNARASSALFELIHHVEVLLRNALIRELATRGSGPNMPPGSPWVQGANKVQEVEGRLKQRGKEITEARIYAGLTFGFWQTMFGTAYEELWRHTLQYAFPNSRADRKVLTAYLESINSLRNRIAHHGSLIERDTRVEAKKLLRLASWIDADAAKWLESIEQVTRISEERPINPRRNVVVVAGEQVWQLYSERHQPAYVFQVARPIQVVEYVAFYADQEIKPKIAKIAVHFDAVDWNKKNSKRLLGSANQDERILGGVISASMGLGWTNSAYQVFILSAPSAPETVTLPNAIKHSRRGRGSAFVRGQRYLSLSELQSAGDTVDIVK